MSSFTIYEDNTATSGVSGPSSPAAAIAQTGTSMTTGSDESPSMRIALAEMSINSGGTKSKPWTPPTMKDVVRLWMERRVTPSMKGPARLDALPLHICTLVMKHSLPAYTDFNTAHDPNEPVPILHLRAYWEHIRPWMTLSSKLRKAARQACADINNIGAFISTHSADAQAVITLGADILKTSMVDLDMTRCFRPFALMRIVTSAYNAEHLYLVVSTNRTHAALPQQSPWKGDIDIFLYDHGDGFARALRKLKTVDIDLVCEDSIAKVGPFVGQFLCETWMGVVRQQDDALTDVVRRYLRLTRPKVTVSCAQESKTYSNVAFC